MKSKVIVFGGIILIAITGLVFYFKSDRSARDVARDDAPEVSDLINPPDYQQSISKTIEDPPQIMEVKVRDEATQQLVQSPQEIQVEERETRQTGVSELEEQEIESLIRKLDSENNDERYYARIDLLLKGKAVIPFLVAEYAEIKNDPMKEWEIINILSELESDALEETIVNQLNKAKSPEQGFFQIQYLEVIDSEERYPFLEEIINSEKTSQHLLMVSLRSLIKDGRGIDYDRFLNHSDPYIQGVTLLYVVKKGMAVDFNEVKKIAKLKDTKIKLIGIQILGEIADERSEAILEELMKDDSLYSSMKAKIENALLNIEVKNMDDGQKVERLMAIRQENRKLSRWVINQLSKIDSKESTEALKGMLEDRKVTMDYSLIKALMKRGYTFERRDKMYALKGME